MGLDASVYCDCFERGLLKSVGSKEWKVFIDDNGSRATGATDLEVQLEFDRWNRDEACEHPDGVYLHHYIGNITLIAALRAALEASNLSFPIILGSVIHDGTHSGDSLPVERLPILQREIARIGQVRGHDADEERLVRDFEQQMQELVNGAIRLNKPISF